MFEKIRNEIIDISKDKKYLEITKDTDYNYAGIYLIYINNFNDDKIVPFYIGQTNDFQHRHQQHFKEIMSLNRLKYKDYENYFKFDLYNGNYKSCKIFKYMVEHSCTLKDFHMVILERIDNYTQDLLDSKEQEYFDRYLPSFFGFNQFNHIIDTALYNKELIFGKDHKKDIDNIYKGLLKDSKNLLLYYEYGFCDFNYYLCFPKSIEMKDIKLEESEKEELKNNIDELCEKYFNKKEYAEYNLKESQIPKLKEKLSEINEVYEKRLKELKEKYEKEINSYISNNKINKDQINRIYYLLYNCCRNTEYHNEQINIFEKYLKKRKIDNNIVNDLIENNKKFFDEFGKETLKIDEVYKKTNDFIEDGLWGRKRKNLAKIFPTKEYDLFPLKDTYQTNTKDDKLKNTIVIEVVYNNNNKSNRYVKEPLLINYSIYTDKLIVQKSNLIKESDYTNYSTDYIKYYEKVSHNPFEKPFQLESTNLTYISVGVEYRYGVNEYTIENNKTYSISETIKDIEKEIEGLNLKFIVHSNSKKEVERNIKYLECSQELKDKLLKAIKSHK